MIYGYARVSSKDQKLDRQLLELKLFGINEDNIYVTGIPLSNRFLEKHNNLNTFKEFNLEQNLKTILFFGGGKLGIGKSRTLEIFQIRIDAKMKILFIVVILQHHIKDPS